ncbi:LysR family transcriptional regulator [Staphylococcus sp. NRL 16/872]|nr:MULTISPECIES: LysR family transcriptional regulator [unclassified Staphylococcus]WEN70613.1 LysR family transcriptional regulator [Staphylococcus sp. NRL 16/872]
MDFNYLHDFIVVVKHNSLNKAALELNISVPALSKRMKKLEDYCGFQMFHRTNKGVFLTGKGEKAYDMIMSIDAQLKNLSKIEEDETNNYFRLGILPSFSLSKLNNRLNDLDFLKVTIENNTAILYEKLKSKALDVILGDISSLKDPSLFTYQLYSEEFIVISSPQLKIKNGKNLNIEDLKDDVVYIQNPPCDTYTFIKSNQLDKKMTINYLEHQETILAHVRAGKGINILPKTLAIQVDYRHLNYQVLSGYSRTIGIATYNKELFEYIKNHL